MVDRPTDPGAPERADDGPDRVPTAEDGAAAGTPRWVIGFAIAALVAVALFVALHLAGGGFRGHGGP